MKIIYTKHAEEKLLRKDIKAFKINKKLIADFIEESKYFGRTKYGERTIVGNLSSNLSSRNDRNPLT